MKNHLILLLLFCCSMEGMANVAADTVVLIETPPISLNEVNQDALGLWHLESLKDSLYHEVVLSHDSHDSSTLSIFLEDSKYRYRLAGDSLFSLGYENATTQMSYRTPILMLTRPLKVGQHYNSTYIGEGEYCHLLPIKVAGQTETTVLSSGTLALPGSKTDSVYEVRIIHDFTESAFDTAHFILEQYLWISSRHKYPLLESRDIRTIHQCDTISHKFVYYCVFENKDEDSIQYQSPETKEPGVCLGALSNVRFLPNPVVNYLTIVYELTRSAEVHFSLHTTTGIPICSTHPKRMDEGEYSQQMDMSQLSYGNYVLYIYVDDIILSETIIKI